MIFGIAAITALAWAIILEIVASPPTFGAAFVPALVICEVIAAVIKWGYSRVMSTGIFLILTTALIGIIWSAAHHS